MTEKIKTDAETLRERGVPIITQVFEVLGKIKNR